MHRDRSSDASAEDSANRRKHFREPLKVRALNGAFTIYAEYPLPNGESIRPRNAASLRMLVTELTGEHVVALYRSIPESAAERASLLIEDTEENMPTIVYAETASSAGADDPRSTVTAHEATSR
jgi:hypothetical protein